LHTPSTRRPRTHRRAINQSVPQCPSSRVRTRVLQKWRLRYFVLYAPPSSSVAFWRHGDDDDDEQSAAPLLCYYDDETLERQRGRIVLGRCADLVDRVPLSSAAAVAELRHLFAVRSAGRTGHRRTYYMAATSDEELTAWIDAVRRALSMYGHYGKRPTLH